MSAKTSHGGAHQVKNHTVFVPHPKINFPIKKAAAATTATALSYSYTHQGSNLGHAD